MRNRLLLGSNALLVTIIGFVVLGVVYAIAKDVSVSFDFSRNAQNTLSPQTLTKLRQLEETNKTVRITYFSPKSDQQDSATKVRMMKDLMKNVTHASSVVEWEYIDFDEERLTAERLKVKEYGRVVIQRGDARVDIRERSLFLRKKSGLVFAGEQEFSQAFSQLLHAYTPTMYLLDGHEEPQLSDASVVGLSAFGSLLEEELYQLLPLQMLRSGMTAFPADANIVASLAPKQALSTIEEQSMELFLGKGGSVFFALEPESTWWGVLSRLGVERKEGIAVDERSMFPHWDRPIVQLGSHEITEPLLANSVPVVLSGAVPLEVIPKKGVRVSTLLSLSPQGWIDIDRSEGFNHQTDVRAQVPLALAIEVDASSGLLQEGVRSARVVVLSDVDMMRNELLKDVPGNAPFVQNVVFWMMGNAQYTGSGKRIELEQLTIAKPQLPMLRFLALVPLPFCTVIIGFAVWWSRRGR